MAAPPKKDDSQPKGSVFLIKTSQGSNMPHFLSETWARVYLAHGLLRFLDDFTLGSAYKVELILKSWAASQKVLKTFNTKCR